MVNGNVTVAGLEKAVEFDPRVLAENAHGIFDVVINITLGTEKHTYRVWGYNAGNGYLRCTEVEAKPPIPKFSGHGKEAKEKDSGGS